MYQPSPAYLATIRSIDWFTGWVGWLVAWLVVPLVIGVTWEVVARYLFNAPTIWAYDLSYMLYASIFMLGASYALQQGAHIRTDMLWEGYSDRTKGIIDSVAYIVFFFPALLLLFVTSFDDAYYAWQIGERSEQTAWRPILWPLKAVIPATALLLMLQGVSELLKSLYAVRTGQLFEKHEVVQI